MMRTTYANVVANKNINSTSTTEQNVEEEANDGTEVSVSSNLHPLYLANIDRSFFTAVVRDKDVASLHYAFISN